jgi:hypothetical protein
VQSKYHKEEEKPEYKKEEDYKQEVSSQTWGDGQVLGVIRGPGC